MPEQFDMGERIDRALQSWARGLDRFISRYDKVKYFMPGEVLVCAYQNPP